MSHSFMYTSRSVERAIIALVLSLLGCNFIFKLASLHRLHRASHVSLANGIITFSLLHVVFTFAHAVRTGGIWDVERKPVAFQFDLGLHYGFNASAAWGALVPGAGLVHLGPHREPFMVSMLHQLRCLDIMRDQLAKPRAQREEQPARHCMNYIRQMILCRGDTQLDPYQYPSNNKPVDANPIRRCLDWRAVYDAVDENQREYAKWIARGSNREV
ncbi:hypothetical protein BN946_scf184573.g5 [Trametes cinnabarina]|uniref:Uncharacterized protein n=1 Tax=Pycnoporus cinnabarinus TaxID=5643 RepID=A0A060S7R1_PYCCI|nr:hypothetical protein BN946_scf184573.g5 [Trametes cinnabarina]